MLRVLVAIAVVGFTCRAVAAELAVTMDDFDAQDVTRLTADQRNASILAALDKHGSHAALFVSCKNLRGAPDKRRLAAWSKAGHMIANHSWSHAYFGPDQSVSEEIRDIKRCDALLKKVDGYRKRFRYPFLAEGDTVDKRDALRGWLTGNGFKSGAVTIDASDWYVDQRLRARLAKDPKADLTPYRDFYLAHMLAKAQYYDGLSQEVLGRSVKHTLLMHFNLLNALFLDDLLSMFESHGWKVIDAAEAFSDPVFDKPVDVMPAGQSVLWAHAKAGGRADLRYPAEDGNYEKAAMDALGL